MLRPETRARAHALQLLYAWELQGCPDFRGVARGLACGPGPSTDPRALALASAVAADPARLDHEITQAVEHWRMERLGVVERIILRVGVRELLDDTTPAPVVIDEAVRIARWFAGDRAPAFVNGVLDAVARRLHRL
ncbi:MAG TPA: transcription antitermination factor NusB [Gemmatimonadales bacterium]|nr:transcription antitermination factor NusB [Gemmatimonadales bacterium]